MAVYARGLVSKKKVRFQEDGFDLDLTYITPRIIAMGFPSCGTESVFRNPRDEVQRFFTTRHKARYRLYNLCAERAYEFSQFDGNVRWFPFDDHNAPAPISLIPAFVQDASAFLAAHPENVVAVHCKAGKGRTGVMISCLLMQLVPELRAPEAASAHFGKLRTSNGKGVTIPSQHRYVRYWSAVLNDHAGLPPPAAPKYIKTIAVAQAPTKEFHVVVVQGTDEAGAEHSVVWDSRFNVDVRSDQSGGAGATFNLLRCEPVQVHGDVKVMVMKGKALLCQVWVNTALERDTVVLRKGDLDVANKKPAEAGYDGIELTLVMGDCGEASKPAKKVRAPSPVMYSDDDDGLESCELTAPAERPPLFALDLTPHKHLFQRIAHNSKVEVITLVVFGWFVLWLLLGSDALPDGPVFPVAVLYIAAVVCGALISCVRVFGAAMPDLLGMLLVGCLLKNVGAVDGLHTSWSGAIRKMALAVILVRAGLVLSVAAVRRNGRATILLSFLPCLIETAVVAVAARLILSPTLAWSWCVLLGFVIAAVSPAVIVPSLTDLKLEGYGVKKGIPSMVLAAAGIDDVIAVAGFGMAFGLTFSSSSLAMSILHAPIDLAIGVVGSVVAGFCMSFLVGTTSHEFQAMLLVLIGVGLIVGLGKVDHTGGGALATMFIGVALRHYANRELPEVNAWCGAVWNFIAKPLLFVMIGTAVDVSTVTGSLVGKGAGILALGLLFRLPCVMLCTHGTVLSKKERWFVMMSWFPKATVQAALGPLALDEVNSRTPVDATHKDWAEQILTLSVLAIIITAPIGAVLIEVFGRQWLTKGDAEPTAPAAVPPCPDSRAHSPAACLPPPRADTAVEIEMSSGVELRAPAAAEDLR